MKKLSFLVAILALAGNTAWADGLQSLDAFLHRVQSGTADFTQTVTAPAKDGQPGRVTTSSGHFAFERPGKFRFDYRKPFPQLIVADGTTLWVYDEDLNQATARAQQDTLDSTAASIIATATSRTELERNFTLENLGADAAQDGLQWIRATPKVSDGQVRSLRIGFQGEQLVAVDMEDNFAQHSSLRLKNFATNATVPASQFQFQPPAGADVIRDQNGS